MRIAPSILAADLADLATALHICERGGAELVHVDVMDGHFVPNLTIGIPVIQALTRHTQLPLDVHLMVSNPEQLLDSYAEAGAARVAVHWEATTHLHATLGRIRAGGAEAGVAINPGTPVEVLTDVLAELDFVLLMSVNPGFAGQSFIASSVAKTRRLKSLIDASGRAVRIELDGGVSIKNIRQLAEAGAEDFVVGSALFGAPDPITMIQQLKARAEGTTGDDAERNS